MLREDEVGVMAPSIFSPKVDFIDRLEIFEVSVIVLFKRDRNQLVVELGCQSTKIVQNKLGEYYL